MKKSQRNPRVRAPKVFAFMKGLITKFIPRYFTGLALHGNEDLGEVVPAVWQYRLTVWVALLLIQFQWIRYPVGYLTALLSSEETSATYWTAVGYVAVSELLLLGVCIVLYFWCFVPERDEKRLWGTIAVTAIEILLWRVTLLLKVVVAVVLLIMILQDHRLTDGGTITATRTPQRKKGTTIFIPKDVANIFAAMFGMDDFADDVKIHIVDGVK